MAKSVLSERDNETLARAEAKLKCRDTLAHNAVAVCRMSNLMHDNRMTTDDALVILANINDPNGRIVAGKMMPRVNWMDTPLTEESHYALGLASKRAITETLGLFDLDAVAKLRRMTGVAVVVVDHGVADVFIA